MVNFVQPGPEGPGVPFHAMVVGRHSVAESPLTLGKSYVAPGLEAFLGMVRTGRPPIGYDDPLRPIAFLEAVASALPEQPAARQLRPDDPMTR